VEVRLTGTGGGDGWPQPGCGCASCERARAAGRRRAPAQLLVDGVLRIGGAGGRGGGTVPGGAAGHRIERVPGGRAVTAPDGGRLLVGDGPGGGPPGSGPPGSGLPGGGLPGGGLPGGVSGRPGLAHAAPYDIVLLDLLANPAQLGELRRQGLVHDATVVAVLHADHRVPSEEELARRCGFWAAIVPADGDVLTSALNPATAATRPRRVLVLGGARSGKSRHAELRLAAEPRVTYLAAGPYQPGAQPAADADWAERVAAHKARRPAWWQTVESTDAAGMLRSESGAVLFDGAGTWLAAVMDEAGAWACDGAEEAGVRIAARVDELLEAWRQTRARVVAVSDEVGSSVHPPTRAGRLFRDQLGWLNQRLAAESEQAVLMVAGRALTLPS
jgi:adenosylcobinamide kinase / adenosylcobinamide-phosphate guanylyltransferase